MDWFRPKTTLDKAFEAGVIFKGVYGAVEAIVGLLLLVVPARAIEHLAWLVTHNELAEDPTNFLAVQVSHYGHQLAGGRVAFALIFLIPHGAVKAGLALALLRQRLWAYPWALVALTLFLAYQIYLLAAKPSVIWAVLTLLDIAIIWLVWREWQKVRKGPQAV